MKWAFTHGFYRLYGLLVSKTNLILEYEKPLIVLTILAMISVGSYEFAKKRWYRSHSDSGRSTQIARTQLVSIPYFTGWRERFVETAKPLDSDGFVRGFFLGKDEFIPTGISAEFKVAGLYHLLAASGFNCFIVSACFLLLARLSLHLFWFRLKTITAIRLKMFITPFFSITGAWVFFLWSDQSPPIVRSAIMITVKYFLDFIGIRPRFSRVLFVHYIAFLIFAPKLFSSASFELTFGCLFGILLVENIKIKTIQKYKLLNFIVRSMLTSFGASLGALPATWIFFDSINFTSIFTNFFAVPITSFLIMPASLLGMLILTPLSSQCGFMYAFQHFLASFPIQFAAFTSQILKLLVETYLQAGPVLHYVN